MRIAIANSKGGVGKSTLTVMLADYLAVFQRLKVLVIDLDPQATSSCLLRSVKGVESAKQQCQTLAHYLEQVRSDKSPELGQFRQINASNLVELNASPQAGRIGRIDLIASVPSLWFEENAFVEQYYSAGQQPAEQLFQALSGGLENLVDRYDVVLIDCPPNYSALTRAGLMLADVVISPTTADEIALMSLRDFRQYAVKAFPGDPFKDRHFIAVTRLGRNKAEAAILNELRRTFAVIDPPIRYSTQVARAIWFVAPESRKRYKEKYPNFLSGVRSDIEAFGKEVYTRIINPTMTR